MIKTVNYNGEEFEAKRIVKTSDSIIGYNGDIVVFKFSGVTDFSGFTLAEGQEFDLAEPTDKERIEQLENMLIMMMEVM